MVQSISLPVREPIPIVTSPVHKPIQQTSAHSTATTTAGRDRNSGGSLAWPNRPKRVYQVIPSLNNSRKTSRQSSVGGQHDHIKISEIQSPQSSAKPSEKRKDYFLPKEKTISFDGETLLDLSVSSIQFRGQYHYGPEAEEVEILPNDPENIDPSSSPHDEVNEGDFYETLHTDQFLRESSANVKNRASVFEPEISSHSRTELHDPSESLLHPDEHPTNMYRSTTPTRDVHPQSRESFMPKPPEHQIDRQAPPRIGSRSTVASNQLYHRTSSDLVNQNDPLRSDDRRQSRLSTTTPFTAADPPVQTPVIHSKAIATTSPALPSTDNNVSGLVAYFFSDFGNEGEGEEEILPIDQSNFAVPTGAEIIADDDIRSTIVGPSQASLLILHSAHVPQQQQQHASKMPSATSETNNERVNIEEKEEIASRATDATKKHISTATSILPSPLPSPKQVLPTSIIDDMQTHFTRNNNANNDDHYRQSSASPANMNVFDSNLDNDEKRSINSRPLRRSAASSKASGTDSRVQSRASGPNDEPFESNNEKTSSMLSRTPTPLENLDDKGNQTPERIESADQRIESATRKFSRTSSKASNHTSKDEERTPINSPTTTLFKNIERQNSTSRMSISHEQTDPFNEQFQPPTQTPIFHKRQNNFGEQPQPASRASTHRESSYVPDERPQSASRASMHREPSYVPDERPPTASRTSMYREPSYVPDERPPTASRTSMYREPSYVPDERPPTASRTSMYREPSYVPDERPQSASRTSQYRESPYVPVERSQPTSRTSMHRELPSDPAERFEPASRGSMYRELPNAPDEQSQPASRRSVYRETSQLDFERPKSRQPSAAPSEEYFFDRPKSGSRRPSSARNQDIGQSFEVPFGNPPYRSTDNMQTPTNDNEPQPFTVESEHFLQNHSQTSLHDLNRRLPSGYSMSHPNDSRRTSATSSPLPVALDSPDVDNNPQPSSRTATPMRKTSVSSIDLPPDPNTLLTSTDEPDPDDPTIIHSTIHFQMLSSQQPRAETPVSDRNEPSPLLDIAPIQKAPSRLPSVELPSELLPTGEQSPAHKPSSVSPHNPEHDIELEQNNKSPPATPESDILLPSSSPVNQEQDQPSHRTPSFSKDEHQQESARQSPSLPYPACLEDLMRPTPSPFHSTDEHRQQEQHNPTNRLLSVSPPMKSPENDIHNRSIHQASPPKVESNDIQSPPPTLPSDSPRRGELSNHTSVDGDDTYRQQVYTPSISPQNETVVSPDHTEHPNDLFNQHQIPKHTLAPPRIEPTFITERQRHPSSDKSMSTARSDHQDDDEKSLHRNDLPLHSASIKPIKHQFPPPSSPPPRRTMDDEREMPTLTPSQQHSKLSLRILPHESKRKKFPDHQLSPPLTSSSPVPQTNVSVSQHEKHVLSIVYLEYV